MNDFENIEDSNNTSNETDLNYSPEAVQASADSTPAVQISETPPVTQPQATQEQKLYSDTATEDTTAREIPLEKEYETELTEFQRFHTEMKDALAEKYPHVFKSLTLPNGKNVQIQRVHDEESTTIDPIYVANGYAFLILTEDGVLKVSGLPARVFQNLDGKMIEHMISKKKTEPLSVQQLANEEKKNKKIQMPWEKHAPSDIDFLRRIPKSVLDQEFFTYFGANKDNLYNHEVDQRKEKFKIAFQTNEKIFAELDKKREIELMQKARNQDPRNLLNQL